MIHQTQPTWNSCVSTCLAMILNVPAQQVIDEFHDKYRAREMFEDDYLELKGVPFTLGVRRQGMDKEGIYLLTVPSLNIEGGTHAIINHMVKAEQEGYFYQTLHDPVKGREGKKYYIGRAEDIQNELEVHLNSFTVELFIEGYFE